MPTKIGFQVVSTTGEDEDFRATELNYHGPTVRGWRSPANCAFPQEIVLQLKVMAILHQIQILAHQYLIPQKIEICTSDKLVSQPLDRNNARDLFDYLGFITFSNNEVTGFRSRELKSILIPSKKAKYIKLRIHDNHVNAKNVHNQVSLMAINVLGDEMFEKTDDNEDENRNNNNFHPSRACHLRPSFEPPYFSPYDDLAFEMSVDEETARIIKVIESKMLRAVFEDRLDRATALSITIENLRAAGEILGVYEQEKRKAVHAEDFDRAKAKKFQIDSFRRRIFSTLRVDRLLEETEFADEYDLNSNPGNISLSNENSPRRFLINETNHRETSPSKSPRPHPRTRSLRPPLTHSRSQTFPDPAPPFPHALATFSSNPHLHHRPKHARPPIPEDTHETEPLGTPSSVSDSLTDESLPPRSPENRDGRDRAPVPRRGTRTPPQGARLKASASEQKIRGKVPASVKSSFEAYEDRMLPALKSYHGNEVVRECQLVLGQQRKSTLNEREKKQAMLPIAAFGIEMIEKFYSRSFNEREEGLKQLQQELKRVVNAGEESSGAKPPMFNKVARAAIFLLHRGLRDTVYSVYKLAAETVRLFFAEFVPNRVSPSEVARSVEKLLPELLTKSGDVTPRIHNLAAHTLLSMAECEEVRRLNIIPAHLSRPITSSIHPRLALSRLEMVEQLILNHGISQDKKSGLTCRTLAEFGSSGLHHPAEAVRKVSERILIHVYKVNPRIVRKQLPPDDDVTRRNLLYRQLFQEFDFMDVEKKIKKHATDNLIESFEPNPPSTPPAQKVQQKHKTSRTLGDDCTVEKASPKSTSNFNVDGRPSLAVDFPAANNNDSRSQREKLPHRKKAQPEPPKMRQNETKTNKKAERTSEETEFPIKFPSLTDSIRTTKTRMLSNHKSSPKRNSSETASKKLLSETTVPSGSLTRRELKRTSNYISGIPVPTFGTLRRLPANSVRRRLDKAENSKKLTKPKDDLPQSRIPPKTVVVRVLDVTKNDKPLNEGGINRENGDGTNVAAETEGSVKFSESMLASIRENEFSKSDLFNGQSDKEEKFRTCIFCLSSERWADENSLNKHYLRDCLMLTTCEYCTEVTEISAYTNHLLDDCKWKTIFQKCIYCQEAILRDLYNKHECAGSVDKAQTSKCPFCHTNIGQGETAWRKHLTGNNSCPHHPRQI